MAALCRVLMCAAMAAAPVRGDEALRLHPQNGRYFEIHGRAAVLVGSGEHYGAVIHTDFDYIRYLDETRACGLNLVRVFSGAYREIPGKFDIADNTLAVPAGRFLAPWARSTTPGALDGGRKFDLTRWDAAYFHRLRDFVKQAGARGIFVEFTFFCPFYDEDLWNASPMNPANHINGAGAAGAAACHRLDDDLLPYQKALVRKCAEELRNHPNVYFEIINEPYQGGVPLDWQHAMVDEIVAAEASFPVKHLIAMNVANGSAAITEPHPAVSIFNFHYATPDAVLLNLGLNRVIADDETGFAGGADFPYRREAWEFMLSGGGCVNHLDFSFTTEREDGLASPDAPGGGGPAIRRQLGVLKWFLGELPLERCAPQTGFVAGGVPTGGSARVLGAPDEAYALYLRGGSQADLVVNLPAGAWSGRWLDPRSGGITAEVAGFSHAGGTRTLSSPAYTEDTVLLLRSGELPPPTVRITSPVYQTTLPGGAAVTLTAEASVAGGTLDGVEFLDGENPIGRVASPPYTLEIGAPARGTHLFRARAVASDGGSALSPSVKCVVAGPPALAVNLNGPAVTLNGLTWTSQADAVAAGMQVANARSAETSGALPLYPVLDPAVRPLVSQLLVRPDTPANPELMIAHPVPNGTYDVFLSLVEGQLSYVRDTRVLLEGETAARGIGDLALGEWVNYGPYRTTVSDGTLNVALLRETKGSPKIANLAAYQAEAAVPPAEAELGIAAASGVTILSWPSSVPADRVETSADLSPGGWQPLVLPVEDFGDEFRVSVPTGETRRFFRLRKD